MFLVAALGMLVAPACSDNDESADEFCRVLREPFPIARWVDVGMIVFIEPGASEPETLELIELVESDPNVAEVTFIDREQALDEFLELFADQPEMTAQVSAEQLPPSLRIRLYDDLDGLAMSLGDHPHVYRVIDRASVGADRPSIDQAVRPLTIQSESPVPAAALWSAGGSNPALVEHAPESLADDMAVLDEFWRLAQRETNDERVVAAARQVAAFYDTECS